MARWVETWSQPGTHEFMAPALVFRSFVISVLCNIAPTMENVTIARKCIRAAPHSDWLSCSQSPGSSPLLLMVLPVLTDGPHRHIPREVSFTSSTIRCPQRSWQEAFLFRLDQHFQAQVDFVLVHHRKSGRQTNKCPRTFPSHTDIISFIYPFQ